MITRIWRGVNWKTIHGARISRLFTKIMFRKVTQHNVSEGKRPRKGLCREKALILYDLRRKSEEEGRVRRARSCGFCRVPSLRCVHPAFEGKDEQPSSCNTMARSAPLAPNSKLHVVSYFEVELRRDLRVVGDHRRSPGFDVGGSSHQCPDFEILPFIKLKYSRKVMYDWQVWMN